MPVAFFLQINYNLSTLDTNNNSDAPNIEENVIALRKRENEVFLDDNATLVEFLTVLFELLKAENEFSFAEAKKVTGRQYLPELLEFSKIFEPLLALVSNNKITLNAEQKIAIGGYIQSMLRVLLPKTTNKKEEYLLALNDHVFRLATCINSMKETPKPPSDDPRQDIKELFMDT